MNSTKLILLSIFFFVFSAWANEKVSDMSNMTGGASVTDQSEFAISNINRTLAKAFHMFAFADCIAALVLFFIARRNAKTNYTKAKKFFLIGLVCFVSAIIFFLLPKLLFLSPTFPGNFDMRAT